MNVCRGGRGSGKEGEPGGEEGRAGSPARQAHARSRCMEAGMCSDTWAGSEDASLPFGLSSSCMPLIQIFP